MMKLIGYTDAGLTETAMCVVYPDREPYVWVGRLRRDYVTVNIAEYEAVLRCLTVITPYVMLNQGLEVALYTDSKLVVEQVAGNWRASVPHLRRRRNWVRLRMQNLGCCTLQWIPREQNYAGRILEGEPESKIIQELKEIVG